MFYYSGIYYDVKTAEILGNKKVVNETKKSKRVKIAHSYGFPTSKESTKRILHHDIRKK
jgi:hypothetical protein